MNNIARLVVTWLPRAQAFSRFCIAQSWASMENNGNEREQQNVQYFFGFHICDHVFSYSSDYSVVISSACSVLSFDRWQLPEQEKYVVACITTDPEPVT